jgi:hypothetical protein
MRQIKISKIAAVRVLFVPLTAYKNYIKIDMKIAIDATTCFSDRATPPCNGDVFKSFFLNCLHVLLSPD